MMQIRPEGEENPVPITFLEINAEPEVRCMLGRYHKYTEIPVVFLISISLPMHMQQLHAVDRILKSFVECCF
jgi:hypothetical protein